MAARAGWDTPKNRQKTDIAAPTRPPGALSTLNRA